MRSLLGKYLVGFPQRGESGNLLDRGFIAEILKATDEPALRGVLVASLEGVAAEVAEVAPWLSRWYLMTRVE